MIFHSFLYVYQRVVHPTELLPWGECRMWLRIDGVISWPEGAAISGHIEGPLGDFWKFRLMGVRALQSCPLPQEKGLSEFKLIQATNSHLLLPLLQQKCVRAVHKFMAAKAAHDLRSFAKEATSESADRQRQWQASWIKDQEIYLMFWRDNKVGVLIYFPILEW